MENHQEKQHIFDEYARTRDFENWNDLKNCCIEYDIDLDEYIFDVCDLVQEEQQKRIAESITMKYHDGSTKKDSFIEYYQIGADNLQVDKASIINPENLMTEDEFMLFMFEACDLVQEEQQKRIAKKFSELVHSNEVDDIFIGDYNKMKASIINPENKIQ